MKDVKRVTYIKRGGEWTDAYIDDDPIDVYKDLISCFESKFLLGSKSIGRITRNNNFDGTENITVYYKNDVKYVFTIEN